MSVDAELERPPERYAYALQSDGTPRASAWHSITTPGPRTSLAGAQERYVIVEVARDPQKRWLWAQQPSMLVDKPNIQARRRRARDEGAGDDNVDALSRLTLSPTARLGAFAHETRTGSTGSTQTRMLSEVFALESLEQWHSQLMAKGRPTAPFSKQAIFAGIQKWWYKSDVEPSSSSSEAEDADADAATEAGTTSDDDDDDDAARALMNMGAVNRASSLAPRVSFPDTQPIARGAATLGAKPTAAPTQLAGARPTTAQSVAVPVPAPVPPPWYATLPAFVPAPLSAFAPAPVPAPLPAFAPAPAPWYATLPTFTPAAASALAPAPTSSARQVVATLDYDTRDYIEAAYEARDTEYTYPVALSTHYVIGAESAYEAALLEFLFVTMRYRTYATDLERLAAHQVIPERFSQINPRRQQVLRTNPLLRHMFGGHTPGQASGRDALHSFIERRSLEPEMAILKDLLRAEAQPGGAFTLAHTYNVLRARVQERPRENWLALAKHFGNARLLRSYGAPFAPLFSPYERAAARARRVREHAHPVQLPSGYVFDAASASEALALEVLAEMRYMESLPAAVVSQAERDAHDAAARRMVDELGDGRAGELRAHPLTRHLFLGLAHVELSQEIEPTEGKLVLHFQGHAALRIGMDPVYAAHYTTHISNLVRALSASRRLTIRIHYGNARLFKLDALNVATG